MAGLSTYIIFPLLSNGKHSHFGIMYGANNPYNTTICLSIFKKLSFFAIIILCSGFTLIYKNFINTTIDTPSIYNDDSSCSSSANSFSWSTSYFSIAPLSNVINIWFHNPKRWMVKLLNCNNKYLYISILSTSTVKFPIGSVVALLTLAGVKSNTLKLVIKPVS